MACVVSYWERERVEGEEDVGGGGGVAVTAQEGEMGEMGRRKMVTHVFG